MVEIIYPSGGNSIPANQKTVKLLINISIISGYASLLIGISMVLFSILSPIFELRVNNSVINYALYFALILGGLNVILDKKKALFSDKKQQITGLVLGFIVLLCGIVTANTEISNGLIIILLGISLIIAKIKIHHRFHLSQFLSFIAIAFSTYFFVNNIYFFTFIGSITPQSTALLFQTILLILLCQSILLKKPEKGFFGSLTLDCSSSSLALRFFLYLVLIPPLLGIIIILGNKFGFYNMYSIPILLVVIFTMMSISMNWLNARIQYHTELEIYLIKDALRENNINLQISKENLDARVKELETENKHAYEIAVNQSKLRDLLEELG